MKRFRFVLFDDGLTIITLELAYIDFCIQTLHMQTNKHVLLDRQTSEEPTNTWKEIAVLEWENFENFQARSLCVLVYVDFLDVGV